MLRAPATNPRVHVQSTVIHPQSSVQALSSGHPGVSFTFLREISGRISVPSRNDFAFFPQLICSFSGRFQPDADIHAGRQSFIFENRRIRWVPARPPQIRPTGKEISDTLKNFLSDDILIFIFIMSEEGRKR